jgi:hypothetical protein
MTLEAKTKEIPAVLFRLRIVHSLGPPHRNPRMNNTTAITSFANLGRSMLAEKPRRSSKTLMRDALRSQFVLSVNPFGTGELTIGRASLLRDVVPTFP